MGGYSCSLSAHDQNVLGQCAQLSTHPSPLREKRDEKMCTIEKLSTFTPKGEK
jgi:hypothetical protein